MNPVPIGLGLIMHSTSHFEGPEKKLEVILFSPDRTVRSEKRHRWEPVVKAGRAEIISRISNGDVDAYLLSESSLFVWDDRVLMITCGQTTPVKSLPLIADIVGRENVALVFYERKNMTIPGGSHTAFQSDTDEIANHFPGRRYLLGPADEDHVHLFHSTPAGALPAGDATFQVLMNGLDPSAMEIFSNQKEGTAVQASVLSRLHHLYPGMLLDSHFFSPFGYSLNGIREGAYYTVHVTPQPVCSYASFETNVTEGDYAEVIREMISVFRPDRFTVVLTACMDRHSRQDLEAGSVPGYSIAEKCRYELACGYGVTFVTHIETRARRPKQGRSVFYREDSG